MRRWVSVCVFEWVNEGMIEVWGVEAGIYAIPVPVLVWCWINFACRALFWLLKDYLYYYSITPYFFYVEAQDRIDETVYGSTAINLRAVNMLRGLGHFIPLPRSSVLYLSYDPHFYPPPFLSQFSPPFSFYIFLPARALPLLPSPTVLTRSFLCYNLST